MNLIFQMLSATAVSTILVSALAWLLRSWLSERLKNSIRYEYDLKLESIKTQLKTESETVLAVHKAQLEKDAALLSDVKASIATGQQAGIDRRFKATENLWSAVLSLRNNSPLVAFATLDHITVGEYADLTREPDFQKLTSDLTKEKITAMYSGLNNIESVRPYVGEYLWSLFDAYQTIFLRMAFAMCLSKIDATKLEWWSDPVTKRLINAILSDEEIKDFDSMEFKKIQWLRANIESKILKGISKVVSGEQFGTEALHLAQEITNAVDEVKDQTRLANQARQTVG